MAALCTGSAEHCNVVHIVTTVPYRFNYYRYIMQLRYA
jgi:hypothetical protein